MSALPTAESMCAPPRPARVVLRKGGALCLLPRREKPSHTVHGICLTGWRVCPPLNTVGSALTVRRHPDRFQQKFAKKISATEMDGEDGVMARVVNISQTVTNVYNEL